MTDVHDTVETVNAAASAIVSAETRVQPPTVQKRRWGSCWSLYWCFGSYKHNKRIGHAVLITEATMSGSVAPVPENQNHSTTRLLPFIAPPSSPASFLQSDPPSSTQSPGGFLSLASLSINAYSPGRRHDSIFATGPYAHETQLVSPPVFSTFTTEPSTASFTPPPEPVQLTTPSSPEVPFAQLLTSSLNSTRARRNSRTSSHKFASSQYEFQSYHPCPDSPVGHLISPGSVISNSGTSSPYPGNAPIIEFPMLEASRFLGYEHFYGRKWGSRLGSGSLTPNGGEPPSRDSVILESQISEVASLANSENESENVISHRVSFELTVENSSVPLHEMPTEGTVGEEESRNELRGESSGQGSGEQCHRRRHSITFGSIKEFNFDSTKEQVTDSPQTTGSEWWANKNVAGKELDSSRNNWTFFPMLQPEVN